jgi:hypothetical protein
VVVPHCITTSKNKEEDCKIKILINISKFKNLKLFSHLCHIVIFKKEKEKEKEKTFIKH